MKKLFITVDVAFHDNDMYYANLESSLQGENQTEVQTLDYSIPDTVIVNDLDSSGDVLETSETNGDHSHENNVNELELSGNSLETSGDHSHENNVENLERDELTSSNSSLPTFAPPTSSLPSQLASPSLSPNNHNQSPSISDAPPPCHLPNRGSVNDRRSTSSYFTFVEGNLVTWRSKKLNVVARSSTKAEYRGMDLGIKNDQPMKLFCYNKVVHDIAHNPIPTNISHCKELRVLDLYSNTLIGQLSSLLDINILWFDTNNLIGTIPSWIGNFSSLYGLYIGGNNFQGSIPNELGRLTGLQAFSVAANNLSGMVPPSIYNISSITIFGVRNIPASFSNASRLSILDLPENCLNGTIPAESLGSLQSLVRLNLGANRLETSNTGDLNFISFLANCTSLEVLAFYPAYDKQFSESFPSSLGNLTLLTKLFVNNISFKGNMPPSIGNLQHLLMLDLSSNNLTGTIPEELIGLSSLSIYLRISNNHLSGLLPSKVGNLIEGTLIQFLQSLRSLEGMDLSSNNFSGQIPEFIGKFLNSWKS
nr:receptor kinase-like protein Xa21 [Malus domestica]